MHSTLWGSSPIQPGCLQFWMVRPNKHVKLQMYNGSKTRSRAFDQQDEPFNTKSSAEFKHQIGTICTCLTCEVASPRSQFLQTKTSSEHPRGCLNDSHDDI